MVASEGRVIFCCRYSLFTEDVIPQTPIPDYGDINSPENQNVFSFAKKFKNVLKNIQKIGNSMSFKSFTAGKVCVAGVFHQYININRCC